MSRANFFFLLWESPAQTLVSHWWCLASVSLLCINTSLTNGDILCTYNARGLIIVNLTLPSRCFLLLPLCTQGSQQRKKTRVLHSELELELHAGSFGLRCIQDIGSTALLTCPGFAAYMKGTVLSSLTSLRFSGVS